MNPYFSFDKFTLTDVKSPQPDCDGFLIKLLLYFVCLYFCVSMYVYVLSLLFTLCAHTLFIAKSIRMQSIRQYIFAIAKKYVR